MAEADVVDQFEFDHDADIGAQYLLFELAEELYGVDILRVQEIRGWEYVTRLPNSPPYVKGVLNLRGAIVPVYDLKLRFELGEQAYNKETVVIVLKVNVDDSEKHIGVVVDAVSDVVHEGNISITKALGMNDGPDNKYISNLATVADRMVMLLDADRLYGDTQADKIEAETED